MSDPWARVEMSLAFPDDCDMPAQLLISFLDDDSLLLHAEGVGLHLAADFLSALFAGVSELPISLSECDFRTWRHPSSNARLRNTGKDPKFQRSACASSSIGVNVYNETVVVYIETAKWLPQPPVSLGGFGYDRDLSLSV